MQKDLQPKNKEGLNMSISGKKQMVTNLHNDEPIKIQPDQKVKMIYERFHNGKSLIMDDLKYLLKKDPEGFERLTESILKPFIGFEKETNIEITIQSLLKNQQNRINDSIDFHEPAASSNNIQQAINIMKTIIKKMSEPERMELISNLNEASELMKISDKINLFDDMVEEKLAKYTYYLEEDFNMFA